MNKKDIFKRLDELDIDKNSYVVGALSSLVLNGVIKKSDIITLFSDDKYDFTDIEFIKYLCSYDYIDNYKVMKIDDCLSYLKEKSFDKKIIKKVELYLSCLDNYQYERKLHSEGYKYIGGVDEVGRGPLVGPVVAACCVLPEKFNLDGLTDSKKLSEKKREYYFEEIKKQAISYGIGIVSCKKIDEINIYQATKEAMIQAINNCHIRPDYLLTDAMKLDVEIPIIPIIKGDLKSISISAASVLAKVTRDRMLYELDKKYPMYDFKNNVGYPTKKHLDAIDRYGIIDEHRRSYAPVKNYLENSIKKNK